MQQWPLARLARLRCRVVSEALGPGPVASRLAGGTFCLAGAWAGGGALVGGAPLHVSDAPLTALAVQPRLDRPDPDVVGGGWFGVLGYDGASRLAFHDHVLRLRGDTWHFEALWSDERAEALTAERARWAALLAEPDCGSPLRTFDVSAFGGAERWRHLASVEHAVAEIRAGEIYQVNVCTRLAARFAGSPGGAFDHLVTELRPPYAARLAAPAGTVLSMSPELFLRRRGREVTTTPIKGTAVDRAVLRASAKDAAENVMIVDLMRNDLGRVCEPGSVRVPALFGIEEHPGLYHLVSRVDGRLRPDVDDAALLRATFPPGSVTGAPKARACSVIGALERSPRGTYTGALGFASPSWGAEYAVAIRTFELTGSRIELGVGGGVTADSVPMLEWRECLTKAAPLLAPLGSGLADDVRTPAAEPELWQRAGGLLETLLALDGHAVRVPDHLARLDRSCRELYGGPAPADLARRIAAAVEGTTGRFAVRVQVSAQLVATVTAAALPGDPPAACSLVTARRPDAPWRHKWAARHWADRAEQAAGARTPLFVAADGTVLETTRGNVFLLRPDGTLVTPPLRDDLLPGITRRALLDAARDAGRPVELRPFEIAELATQPAFWTSSLSLAVPVARVDGRSVPRADAAIAELAAALRSGEQTVR